MKKIFLIGGMSESGKSTFGRYLESKGIPRLKIVSFLESVMKKEGVAGDFVEWNNKNMTERPEWTRKEFTKEFIVKTSADSLKICALESLYGPDLGIYMKNIIGKDKVIIVYIDMALDIRLQRQMIRHNLVSLDEAKKLLLPRDEIKKTLKVPEIEKVADIVIDNSGSLEELYFKADKIIEQHCPEYLSS